MPENVRDRPISEIRVSSLQLLVKITEMCFLRLTAQLIMYLSDDKSVFDGEFAMQLRAVCVYPISPAADDRR